MKKQFGLMAITTILTVILAFNILHAQQPTRKKRSNDLTKKAVSLYQENKFDQAKEVLLKAVQINESNVKAHEMLALLYYQERDFAQTKIHAKKAISISKKAAGAYYVLGMMNYQEGKHEQAKNQLNLSLKFMKNPKRREAARNVLNKLNEKRPRVGQKIKKIIDNKTTKSQEISYKPFVAVFNFEENSARSENMGIGQTLSEMMVTALIQDGKFTVMERVQLEKVLQEQSLSQSGIIDTETAIKVGRLAGLEAVILGSVSVLKSSIEADARLIEIETGKALAAASSSVKNIDNIRDVADRMAKQLGEKAMLLKPEKK
ncbi:hypothetical protein B6I21_00275 [candidate division KSB1 bacterium 4572_119]|nr:MAG: hypothetical protein B6I21_00275 [candidate division KSB1 bacterium 4572_119]